MKKTSNKGFTLVELIVIMIILAIIAALLVPTLMGYIEEARAKKYLPNAKSCLDAAQAMFSQQYGRNDGVTITNAVVSGAREVATGNQDQDITNTRFAADILNLAGVPDGSPYLFMVGVGSMLQADGPVQGYSRTIVPADKYTVYYAVYMETANSKAWYYYNGEWTTTNPRLNNTSLYFSDKNIVLSGPDAGIRIQYYLISNHNPTYQNETVSKKAFWDWLKAME